MTQEEILAAVPGAQSVVEWFGAWPKFHDAEVVNVSLNRSAPSTMDVHGFFIDSEVDEKGYFKTIKHAIVRFVFEQVVDSDLQGFNRQNVLSELNISKDEQAFVVSLSTSYGLDGTLTAKSVSVELTPGIPSDSQYAASIAQNTADTMVIAN